MTLQEYRAFLEDTQQISIQSGSAVEMAPHALVSLLLLMRTNADRADVHMAAWLLIGLRILLIVSGLRRL